MDLDFGDQFAWDAVVGAVDYKVELSTLAGVIEKEVVTTNLSVFVGELFAGLTGITYGSQHRARVRARDGVVGGGADSPYITFVLVGLPAPTNFHVVV